MQASTTLRRPAVSKRMVAYVIALVAALALGGAAGFVAKSTIGASQAPASVRDSLPVYPIVDEEPLTVTAGSSQSGTPVCSSSICDVNRYEPAQAAQEPSLIDIPTIGWV